MIKIIIMIVLGLIFGGCSTIEPDLVLDMNLSKSYQNSNQSSKVLADKWWRDFGSSELNILVEKALENNPDILVAYEKIEQAKIALASAGAEYMPSVDVKANTAANTTKRDNAPRTNTKNTSASIGISYEIDIWDKVGARIRASKALTDMSVYDYEAVRLSLIANVVQGYIGVLSAKEKLSIAEQHLRIMEDILEILNKKRTLGILDDIDISGQRAAILTQKNSVANYKNRYENEKYALQLLLAEPFNIFDISKESIFELALPEVAVGLPSELLLRRPDIAAKKAAVASNKALIQVADATRYPSFSLSASGGLASDELLGLSSPTSTLGAGLGITYNLFDAGRLKNQVLFEESKANATLQSYRKTILQACSEVEVALSNLYYAKEQDKITTELLEEHLLKMHLIDTKHKYGAVDFETLLEAQKMYIVTKQQTLSTLEIKLNALVTLHKALGGGFNIEATD
ncbi:MAG: TolC family protein [Sulfurimonadaceae bacterium]|jgi:NodT family efflux transporter outer membrane factor (OMF) lipoprotein|nr:TolC family protein [Sulfurimonadaceae bacterium]